MVSFKIPDGGPAIVRLTHAGESNFAVTAYNRDGSRADLLVNEIGQYDGIRPINFDIRHDVTELEIRADGSWTATIAPIAMSIVAGQTTDGSGDEVINIARIEAQTVRVTHSGDSNFVVTAWGQGRDLLINEIGRYEGRVRLAEGTVLLEVVADGQWTFEFD